MKRIAESVCEAVGVLVCYQKLCSRILDYKADSVFGVSGRDENERSSGFQKSLLRAENERRTADSFQLAAYRAQIDIAHMVRCFI